MRIALVVLFVILAVASAAEHHKIGHAKHKRSRVDAEGIDWDQVDDKLASVSRFDSDTFDSLSTDAPLKDEWEQIAEPVAAGSYQFDGIPQKWKDYSMEEVLDWANGAYLDEESTEFSLFQSESAKAARKAYAEKRRVESPLPSSYDFFDYYPACKTAGKDQLSCGSCWAFSISTMMEHRVCRAVQNLRSRSRNTTYPDDFHLGPQSLVSCFTNNADVAPNGSCNGGYMYSTLRQIQESAEPVVWTENVAPYRATNSAEKCAGFEGRAATFGGKDEFAFTVGDISYNRADELSGGRWDVEELKREIYENGPTTCFIRTHPSFMGFRGEGVFFAERAEELTEEHSYHAMVIVGWDKITYEGVEYPVWIVENSWGDFYYQRPRGSRHLFYLLRGANVMEIEKNPFLGVDVEVLHKHDSYRDGTSVGHRWNSASEATRSTRTFTYTHSCYVSGEEGMCINKSECPWKTHTGRCPGAAHIQCCTFN